jgi:oligopeptide/dipeptide ABC transporter ATP-binding protein
MAVEQTNREPLLSVRSLQVQFSTVEGVHKAVRGLSLDVMPGEAMGLVGESGSGKSVTALSIMRLIQTPPGRITGGQVLFDASDGRRDMLQLPEKEVEKIRGNEMAMVFQEPMTSLNPIHTCGKQVAEPLILHKGMTKKEARKRALELFEKTGIPSPEERLEEYPHQLSGGMRQRVMIAMALACRPRLLIADEPTTALDVTIQAQILDLMKRLSKEMGSSVILITHDLGVVQEMCDRAAVMYSGQIVEVGTVKELFEQPLHPYTEGLILSIPHVEKKRERLYAIKGTVPNPFEKIEGCPFAPRCDYARKRCFAECPELGAAPAKLAEKSWRLVRCHYPRSA